MGKVEALERVKALGKIEALLLRALNLSAKP